MQFSKDEIQASTSSMTGESTCAIALQTTLPQCLPHNQLNSSYSSNSSKCRTRFRRMRYRLTSVSFLVFIILVTNPSATVTGFSASVYQHLQPSSASTASPFETYFSITNGATSSGRPSKENTKKSLLTRARALHHQKLLHDLNHLQSRIRNSMTQTKSNPDWNDTLLKVETMLNLISDTRRIDRKPYSPSNPSRFPETVYVEASEILDETIRCITNRAFSRAYLRGSEVVWLGVKTALEIMDLQVLMNGNSVLATPYNSVPRKTWVQALHALNILVKRGKKTRTEEQYQQGDAAYTVLERLCTCDGIRDSVTTRLIQSSSSHPVRMVMNEQDFNDVLNSFANIGRMDMAERVVGLQDQTEHAPPLSAVTFSILLKGYGRKKDLSSVGNIWAYICEKGMEVDIVLYNSLINAYVNCGDVESAYKIFTDITQSMELQVEDDLFERVTPNVRTFNTMLKGFVRFGEEARALEITRDMIKKNIWDDVTTNTLVSVLVSANNFDLAESVLMNSTSSIPQVVEHSSHASRKRRLRHPNVEAYTDLLNGYGKAGMHRKALATLRIMRNRGVNPNEHTYSCMIGALAKAQKISQAKKMLDFMESNDGIVPSTITYNAFLSGMLEGSLDDLNEINEYAAATDLAFNGRMDEAVILVKQMMISGVRPNVITVTTMVDAFGRCNPPRLTEAKMFANKFDELGYVPIDSAKVSTALIRTCALSKDLKGACDAYANITKPDVIAYNVFLDACCRCGQVKMALKALRTNAARSQANTDFITPDVVTYTVLLSELLKIGNALASDHARNLYREMKQVWGIQPDKGLIDTILVAMISGGNSLGLSDKDVQFTYEVLRDGRKLDLPLEYFNKREKAVKAVILGRLSEVWKEDTIAYGMNEGPLERKNWNQIDSGFRIWGAGPSILDDTKSLGEVVIEDTDDFLESKNWNSINSGFRLF